MDKINAKIESFKRNYNSVYHEPLQKIIDTFLDICRYINGESLERHNWNDSIVKVNNIPTDIESPTFELRLINELDKNDNSNIELIWGDPQCGKRLVACCIMWFSIYIFKKPVLYVFRNLQIDQDQLQNDLIGSEIDNFNIKYIKKIFENFNSKLQAKFDESRTDYYQQFTLPPFKNISDNGMLNRLSDKDSFNNNDMFSCLMNPTQLNNINEKINEFMIKFKELFSFTIMVDEADLVSPTASNDCSNPKDFTDTTECEKLIAKITKKNNYSIYITGTPHTLLYNITTKLTENNNTLIKISKVHRLPKAEKYKGLSNKKIEINTSINKWWEYENRTGTKEKYDIITDYNKNIKRIINILINRTRTDICLYNSFLISESKLKNSHYDLVNTILNDFPNLFLIIFHGNSLRLYLSQDFVKEIKRLSQKEKRLYKINGIYGDSINEEKGKILPNNYCYFNVSSKKFNIKMIYKLLAMLIQEEKDNNPAQLRTIITISGKYASRGYSFTSDSYESYALHLTDQYFLSHSDFNCTNVNQCIRLQGKYNDDIKLTLWTTDFLEDKMMNFYIPFTSEIEKKIMDCKNNYEIKNIIEGIIDWGAFNFKDNMKYIDARKKQKSLDYIKLFDKNAEGYKLFKIIKRNNQLMVDAQIIEELTKMDFFSNSLPEYVCVNTLTQIPHEALKNEDKQWWATVHEISIEEPGKTYKNIYDIKSDNTESYKMKLRKIIEEKFIPSYHVFATQNKIVDEITSILIIDKINNKKYSATFTPENYNLKTTVNIHKLHDRIIYKDNTGNIWEAKKLEQYLQNLPNEYYWKTPDGYLYFYNGNKLCSRPNIKKSKTENLTHINQSTSMLHVEEIRPSINSPLNNLIPEISNGQVSNGQVSNGQIIRNPDVLAFSQLCIKKAENDRLRFGINEIYSVYKKWCMDNNKLCLIRSIFIAELQKLGFNEHHIKGVDINNKPGKRGYHILLEYISPSQT